MLFTSMNKPSKLDGWKADGGDPCDDDDGWRGVDCSDSSVTKMYACNQLLACLHHLPHKGALRIPLPIQDVFLTALVSGLTVLRRAVTCRGSG